ncbi:acyltransferase [soil metagenome]
MEHSPQRNAALDGLRGYAALVVAIFHSIIGVDQSVVQRALNQDFSSLAGAYDQLNWIMLRIFNGGPAVAFFFILSGTVLFDSLRRLQGSAASRSATFLWRRFMRIYPPLILCLCVTAVAYLAFGLPVSLQGFIENAFLFSFPINGPTWTLSVEMIAAPLMLIAFGGYLIGREAGLLVAGITIALLLNIDGLAAGPIKNFWPYFLVGMLIPTRIGNAVATLLPRYSWVVILAVLLYRGGPTTEKVCGGLLIALLYQCKGDALGTFLQLPASAFLGKISYSFYLYNVMFVEIICAYLRNRFPATMYPLETGLAVSVAVIVLTIPIAYASAQWVERPINQFEKARRPVIAGDEARL